MTVPGGGPASRRGTAALADGHGPGKPHRTLQGCAAADGLGLARVEAPLLARSLLPLAGLIAGGAVVWVLIATMQPLWWSAGWRIGAGQLILA